MPVMAFIPGGVYNKNEAYVNPEIPQVIQSPDPIATITPTEIQPISQAEILQKYDVSLDNLNTVRNSLFEANLREPNMIERALMSFSDAINGDIKTPLQDLRDLYDIKKQEIKNERDLQDSLESSLSNDQSGITAAIIRRIPFIGASKYDEIDKDDPLYEEVKTSQRLVNDLKLEKEFLALRKGIEMSTYHHERLVQVTHPGPNAMDGGSLEVRIDREAEWRKLEKQFDEINEKIKNEEEKLNKSIYDNYEKHNADVHAALFRLVAGVGGAILLGVTAARAPNSVLKALEAATSAAETAGSTAADKIKNWISVSRKKIFSEKSEPPGKNKIIPVLGSVLDLKNLHELYLVDPAGTAFQYDSNNQWIGGGFSGALYKKFNLTGSHNWGKIEAGNAILHLPNPAVGQVHGIIHAVGPNYAGISYDSTFTELLRKTHISIGDIIKDKILAKGIALPLISSAIFKPSDLSLNDYMTIVIPIIKEFILPHMDVYLNLLDQKSQQAYFDYVKTQSAPAQPQAPAPPPPPPPPAPPPPEPPASEEQQAPPPASVEQQAEPPAQGTTLAKVALLGLGVALIYTMTDEKKSKTSKQTRSKKTKRKSRRKSLKR